MISTAFIFSEGTVSYISCKKQHRWVSCNSYTLVLFIIT